MNRCITLIILAIATTVLNVYGQQFNSDGLITFGDRSIKLTEDGEVNLTIGGSELIKINQQMALSKVRWIYPPRFKKKSYKVFADKESAVFNGMIPTGEKIKFIPYSITNTLLKNRKIEVTSKCAPEPGVKFKYNIMMFSIPWHLIEGSEIIVDGRKIKVKMTDQKSFLLERNSKIKTIEFFPGSPENHFKVELQKFTVCYIRTKNGKAKGKGKSLLVAMTAKSGVCSFLIDFGKKPANSMKASEESYAGLDFWKMDRLYMPQYRKCRNLIQNPSFELGVRYYQYKSSGEKINDDTEPYYKVTNSDARFGKNSLSIRAIKDASNLIPFGTFCIPVKANENYSLSFYAKGNKPGLSLCLSSLTNKHPEFAKISPGNTIRIGQNWKRYKFTLRNPNTGLALFFQGKYYGKDKDGRILVDGIQLGKGPDTEFTEKPVGSNLTTSVRGNFLQKGSPVEAKLNIVTSKPNVSGKVIITFEDYFYKKLWQEQITFKTNTQGCTVIPLPFAEKLGRGIFIVRTDIELGDGFKERDFHRLMIMDFLDNKHRNKNLCGISFIWGFMYVCPRFELILDRLKNMGIGAFNKGVFTEKDFKKITDRGFSYFCCSMVDRYRDRKTGKISRIIEGTNGEPLIYVNELKSITPATEKRLEEIIYAKAKRYSYIPSWYFSGECDSSMPDLTKDPKNFARALIATYRAVKKVDPDKIVALTGGPCNMIPQRGTRQVIEYIKGVDGRVKFDAVKIHTYRATPEHPDMDSDAAYFLEQLDKHGYGDVPVYWGEGMHFPIYNIPAWGFTSYKGNSNDKYYAQALSYAMGWGERIASAFYARGWLVAFKYQDRVKTFNGWEHRDLFMDFDLTPYALAKIPNTLGRLLGNASFKKDIRFAPDTRCYIFEDDNSKQPIAVVWSCMPNVDRGKQNSPIARFDFGDLKPEFIDLMENKCDYKGNSGVYNIPVTPFPVFIRTTPNSLADLIKALNKTALLDKIARINVSATPADSGTVKVSFTNKLTRAFEGKAELKFNNKKHVFKLNLTALETASKRLALKKALSPGKIVPVNIQCDIIGTNGKISSQNIAFDFFEAEKLPKSQKIEIDGNMSDWDDIPEFRLKNRTVNKQKQAVSPEKIGFSGDHEATFRVSWDNKYLYMLVEVVDDNFEHEVFPEVARRYNNDCLQIYFDTLCDARSQSTQGFDTNDYNYDVYPNPGSCKPTVFRRFAPEQQAAGGLYAPRPNMIEPNVKSAFKRTAKGYVYELAFPKRLIAPVDLKAGEIIGLGLFIADRDNGDTSGGKHSSHVKSGLTLTPEGYGCYMNPHLFPAMLLSEKRNK